MTSQRRRWRCFQTGGNVMHRLDPPGSIPETAWVVCGGVGWMGGEVRRGLRSVKMKIIFRLSTFMSGTAHKMWMVVCVTSNPGSELPDSDWRPCDLAIGNLPITPPTVLFTHPLGPAKSPPRRTNLTGLSAKWGVLQSPWKDPTFPPVTFQCTGFAYRDGLLVSCYLGHTLCMGLRS